MSSEFYFAQTPFIALGAIWFALMFFACFGTFLIGAKKGGHAAKRYLNLISAVFLAGIVLDLVYASATGQLILLRETLGYGTLIQMLIFGFIMVGISWFMTSSYANSKIVKEAALAAQDVAA